MNSSHAQAHAYTSMSAADAASSWLAVVSLVLPAAAANFIDADSANLFLTGNVRPFLPRAEGGSCRGVLAGLAGGRTVGQNGRGDGAERESCPFESPLHRGGVAGGEEEAGREKEETVAARLGTVARSMSVLLARTEPETCDEIEGRFIGDALDATESYHSPAGAHLQLSLRVRHLDLKRGCAALRPEDLPLRGKAPASLLVGLGLSGGRGGGSKRRTVGTGGGGGEWLALAAAFSASLA